MMDNFLFYKCETLSIRVTPYIHLGFRISATRNPILRETLAPQYSDGDRSSVL